MRAKKQDTTYKSICLILNQIIVSEQVNVSCPRVQEEERKDVEVEDKRDRRVKRYVLYLRTLDEQRHG